MKTTEQQIKEYLQSIKDVNLKCDNDREQVLVDLMRIFRTASG